MRLCIISHAYLESGYRHVLDALSQYPGIELAWITPNRYKVQLQNSSGIYQEESAGFPIYALPIRFAGRQGTFLYDTERLNAALDEFKPDILLHEQEVFALGAGQIAHIAAQRRLPLVMFVNENVYRRLSLPRQWLYDYVLQRSTGLIPISQGASDVHNHWGFRGPSAIIAQMGVRLEPAPVFGPRSAYGLHICFAGRLIHMKGVDCLLRAIAILHSESVPVHCTLAGQGEERAELEALSDGLGISSIVTFAGMLLPADVKHLLQSSDVLVLPSRRTRVWEEQFGRVLVEAMAEGTVTVGSRTGAIGEVIGADDLLFDEEDYVALAHVLRRLATDSTLLEYHQRRVWQRARDHYESSVVTSKKVAFLEEVLHGTRTTP